MASHTIFTTTPTSTNSFLFPNSSSFYGVSLYVKSKFSQSLTLYAVTTPKPLTVFAATKKAVAVLKGSSNVEGVVTLSQDDDGCLPSIVYALICCFSWVVVVVVVNCHTILSESFSVCISTLLCCNCSPVVTDITLLLMYQYPFV